MLIIAVLFASIALCPAFETHLHPTARVILGQRASQFQTSFYCTLYIEFGDDSGTAVCGAAVLKDNRVLTAAHCLVRTDPSSPTNVYLATAVFVRLYGVLRSANGALVRINMQTVRVHPEYRTYDMFADIATFEISKEFISNAFVPLLVNEEQGNWNSLTSWDQLFVVGVGMDRNNALSLGAPRKASLSRRSCTHPVGFGDLHPWSPEWIHQDICAGPFAPCDMSGRCSSSCKGDSGGPLYHRQRNNSVIMYGIVSRGTEHCGISGRLGGRPGIYVSTSNYVSFIRGQSNVTDAFRFVAVTSSARRKFLWRQVTRLLITQALLLAL